ncbi:hypothetical protein ACEPPN_017688 [Leptodophora sp. 'Broadleaf-Isolate-01']
MSGSARPSGNTRSGGAARNTLHLTVESNDSPPIENTEGMFDGEIAPGPYEKGKGRASTEEDLDMSDYVTDDIVFLIPDTNSDLVAIGIPTEEQIDQKQRELEEQMRLLVESKAQDARAKARLAHYENGAARLRRLRAVSVANTDMLVERRAVEGLIY